MLRNDLLSIISPLPSSASGHILLRADGETMTATATTETVSLSLSTPTDYAFSVAPKQDALKTALVGLTGDDVKLTVGNTIVVSAKGRRTIQCVEPDTLPVMPGVDGDIITTDGAALREAIAFTRGAAYQGIDRPMLCGVHLNGKDVVASNGSVMRCVRIANDMPALTIPSATAGLLAKVLPDERITVQASEQRLHIAWSNGSLTSGLAPTGFPPVYERWLSDWSGDSFVIRAEEFARAVTAVAAFTDGKTRPVYINCYEDVILSTDAAEEPLDMVFWAGDDRKILLNGGLLAELLAAFGKSEVTVTLKSGTTDPLMFKDAAGRMGVLLPMRQ
jgi:DNA polymerase III sliding clamp (beta) subunit (PCNA family)